MTGMGVVPASESDVPHSGPRTNPSGAYFVSNWSVEWSDCLRRVLALGQCPHRGCHVPCRACPVPDWPLCVRVLESLLSLITDEHRRYWRRTMRLTSLLLVLWLAVTFGVAFFARELSFQFFGWPFSFWVGAQGAVVVYLGIVFWYERTMNRLDREHGVAEPEDD
jgi:putative solute:sodium symporter small subunit